MLNLPTWFFYILCSSQPSQKYSSRSNAGEVMCKFGPSSEAISTYRGQQHSISVNVGEKFQMKSQCKYMFQKLVDLADGMNICGVFIAIDLNCFSAVGFFVTVRVLVVGKGCCNTGSSIRVVSA